MPRTPFGTPVGGCLGLHPPWWYSPWDHQPIRAFLGAEKKRSRGAGSTVNSPRKTEFTCIPFWCIFYWWTIWIASSVKDYPTLGRVNEPPPKWVWRICIDERSLAGQAGHKTGDFRLLRIGHDDHRFRLIRLQTSKIHFILQNPRDWHSFSAATDGSGWACKRTDPRKLPGKVREPGIPRFTSGYHISSR